MSPIIKFSQASKHSNTIAATYKLIQRSFFGLMLALLVTTLTVVMVGQNSLSIVAQGVVNDPVVQAQKIVDTNIVELTFNSSKGISKTIKYLSKLSNNVNEFSFLAYSELELDKINLEIPFTFTSNNIQKSVDDYNTTKVKILDQYKQSINQNNFDEAVLDLKNNSSISELDGKKTKEDNILISKVTFGVNKDNKEFEKIKKNKKIVPTNEASKPIKIKEQKKINNKQDQTLELDFNDINSIKFSPIPEKERNEYIEQVKKFKQAKIEEDNEKFNSVKQKEEKDKRIKMSDEASKIKKIEIEDKLKNGKKSEITNEDIIILGAEAKKLGLDISVKESSQEVTNNIKEILKIKEKDSKLVEEVSNSPKDKPYIDGNTNETIFNKIGKVFNGLFGSGISASAFYPAQYYENIGHATPGYFNNTAIDVYGGGTSNGTTVGLWWRANSNNQKFDFTDGRIVLSGTNKCLDSSSGTNPYNGAKVHLWDCGGYNWQKWKYDTEGRLRLWSDPSYCLDSDNGTVNKTLYIWQCGSWTEKFRSGDYEMRLHTKGGFPIQKDAGWAGNGVGHAWVAVVKWNTDNTPSEITTFSSWPGTDNNDCSYNGNFWREAFERCTYNSIFVNNWEEGNTTSKIAYNDFSGLNTQDYAIKNISKSFADGIRGNGWYNSYYADSNRILTDVNNSIKNGNPWWYWAIPGYALTLAGEAFISIVFNTLALLLNNLNFSAGYKGWNENCVAYSHWLWNYWGGINYGYKWGGFIPAPAELHNQVGPSQMY